MFPEVTSNGDVPPNSHDDSRIVADGSEEVGQRALLDLVAVEQGIHTEFQDHDALPGILWEVVLLADVLGHFEILPDTRLVYREREFVVARGAPSGEGDAPVFGTAFDTAYTLGGIASEVSDHVRHEVAEP